jgi:cytochrome c-type biogenesis protein CcmH
MINTGFKKPLLFILLLFPLIVFAGPNTKPKAPIVFDDPAIEQDYLELAEELRCMVCQNQNLIDSDADLADDLRREVAKMLKEGKNKEQVTDFMVARYGNFVLYNPPLEPSTWLLWGGPFVLMFLGIFLLLKKVSQSKKTLSADSVELSAEEKAKLQSILANKDSNT